MWFVYMYLMIYIYIYILIDIRRYISWRTYWPFQLLNMNVLFLSASALCFYTQIISLIQIYVNENLYVIKLFYSEYIQIIYLIFLSFRFILYKIIGQYQIFRLIYEFFSFLPYLILIYSPMQSQSIIHHHIQKYFVNSI
jgi:hypothetical protein